MSFKWKKDVKPIASGDIYYDLTGGGYIKPEDFLEDEDAQKVNDALKLIMNFIEEMKENEFIELM